MTILELGTYKKIEILEGYFESFKKKYEGMVWRDIADKIRANPELITDYFQPGIAVIPKEVLKSLLIRSLSATRIKLRPSPPEVYAVEINTALEYEIRAGNLIVRKKKPRFPKKLEEYLETTDRKEPAKILENFKDLDNPQFNDEYDGIKWHVISPAFTVMPSLSEIDVHSHPFRSILPSTPDLYSHESPEYRGIVASKTSLFLDYILKETKPKKTDLVLLNYAQKSKEMQEYFLSAEKTKELAKRYVNEKIYRNFKGYVKDRGVPILIWESRWDYTFPDTTIVHTEGRYGSTSRIRFFDKYEFV